MEDVSSRIVEKAMGLGCQDAIADVVANRSYQIRFAQNEAVISNRWRESTASVFFVYQKRVLASDIKDLSRADEAVERLVKIAKSSQQNPDYAGIADGPFRYARMRPDPKVLSLDEGGEYVEAARYTVVFDPLIFGSLTEQTGGRLGAWTVMAGLSPFGKKIGKKVASPQLTLYDDGSGESIARKRFDAEGVPTRRNVLVNKGVLKTYLHNTSTAKKFRTKTTGNAGLVSPDPHAIFVKPGDRSRDEIFSEVKDGLWLTNTWYTRYQSYVTGDLSTIPRDGIFHIRKGDVVEAWKDIRLTDNLIHLLKNIEALSDEAEQMMWWGEVSIPNSVPYARIKDVGITKSAE